MTAIRGVIGEAMRFGAVGLAATAVHLAVAFAARGLGAEVFLANVAGFLSGLAVSLAGHHHFSFQRRAPFRRGAVRFSSSRIACSRRGSSIVMSRLVRPTSRLKLRSAAAGTPRRRIPIGPVRLIEAGARAPRTLLDGAYVGFWWSPDGATLAAIRIGTVDGAPEIRLVFVDVPTGDIRAEPVVGLSGLFIDQVLNYFDQYALSHRLWAPDSSSFLLPIVDTDGAARVLAVTPDGEVLARLDGSIGFWSP